MVFLVFLAFCLSAVDGQFPRVCSTEAAFHTKTCCPLWKDKSPCGSSSGRGRCRNWSTLHGNKIPLNSDDRLDWPRYYYENTCECHGNYSGFDCGDCKFGHHGEKCDRKKVVLRRELRELTFLEQKRLFSYLALAKTTKCRDFVVLSTGDRFHQETYRFVDASLYDVFVWMHYYSMKAILVNGTFNPNKNFAHQGPAFPGWHRLNLLFLERQIQLMTGDEDFAIPYYDWRGEKNCSICTDELLGTNDAQGVLNPYSHFSFWKVSCPPTYLYCNGGSSSKYKGSAIQIITKRSSNQDCNDSTLLTPSQSHAPNKFHPQQGFIMGIVATEEVEEV